MLKNCGHKSGIETKGDCYHSVCIISFALVKENHQLVFFRQYMATLKEIQKSTISKQLVGNKKLNKPPAKPHTKPPSKPTAKHPSKSPAKPPSKPHTNPPVKPPA